MRRRERRRTLERSFAFTTALLVIVVISASMLLVRYHVNASLARGLEARGRAVAQSIGAVATPSLLAYNYAALQIAAENAVGEADLVYVAIHDKEGALAGMARAVAVERTSFPALPESISEPLARDVTVLDEQGIKLPLLESVVPVRVDGVEQAWGTVRVGVSYDAIHAELRRLEIAMVLLGIVLAVVAVAVGRSIARRIVAPLQTLVEGTEALSSGDTSYRIPVTGARELAELAEAFNLMMDRVQEKAGESIAYQNALAQLNATLEAQVRQRTRELEESEAQYRTLVEHSPDSILIVQNDRVRFVNRAFEETFGVCSRVATASEFRLQSIFEPGYSEQVMTHLRAWERGDVTSPAMVLARDADQGIRELELRGSRTEYRGHPAAECLLVDMTEAKRLREELEDTERLRSLGELSSGVAHDFNNLLGAILGRVQLLRGNGFDSEVDAQLAVIEQAALDGRETVRRIQEFSRTRTDQPFVPVDLAEIIQDAIEITRTRWKVESQRRNAVVEVCADLDEGIAPILGNATELREVFTNLILNGVDAMPRGGKLELRCYARGSQVRAEVEDSGVGMTEAIRRHLFDPFFTTKGQSGTGLGMSVAYGIVTRHEGGIDVRTVVGSGTKFTLEFPAFTGEHDDRKGEEDAMPAPVRPARILIIDDEPSIAELLGDALSGEGHTVEISVSGSEGLKLALAGRYDLVLTDLGMPDITGWEVAARIREETPEVPVILVTGWGTTISRDEVERSGVAAVVHKPFEIKELLQTTAGVLALGLGGPERPAPAAELHG